MAEDVIDEVVRSYIERDVDGPLHAAAVAALDRTVKLILGQAHEDLAAQRLTWAGWNVLMLLAYSKHRSLPITRLARRTGAQASTVTRTVDRLIREGYAIRRERPGDRRVSIIELTPAGDAAQAAVFQAQGQVMWGLSALDDEEASALLDLLRKVRLSLGDGGR